MKTFVFGINLPDYDKEIISSLQNDYSISFRKLYNNIDLMEDKNYLSELKIKSKKQIDYLKNEVETFYKTNLSNKNKIQSNIDKILSYDKPTVKQFKKLNYLKKSLNKKICFGDKKELIKISKNKGNLDKWKNSRLLPLVFYGDKSRFGNRFFDLKKLSEGDILFKLEATDIKIPILFNIKKHSKELIKLQALINKKSIPITVKLTSDKLYITFDESILNNTKIDIKAFYKTISNVKDKGERKKLIANRYTEHENYLKQGKLDRYLSIDLNPDGIGYSIVDKELKIIDKGFLDVSKIYDANKRKYETSIMIKELFKLIKHYMCHTIIIEELNIKNTDLGNKISNRKVNNLWNRGLISQIIDRKCNEEGIIKIEINTAYTSFIGNIQHKEFDPIASSLEIARRGIKKYSKGGFYPEFDSNSFINDKMYDEIKLCSTWKDLYSLFVTAKRSYRRELNTFNFTGYYLGNIKSEMQHLHFK